ncbi:MAG: MFS transporter [Acidobacteria bacterium]|nr:MAG: MFS transporter [Acidobacteriota bacterium]
MNEPEAESTRSRRFAPALTLLFIAILVNYVDRGNLSIAAPLLKDELGISASQLGILFSAFFWSYTALQFVSGWLVDRFDASFVIAGGYLIWSLATSATGIVHGFAMLAFMRLLLGVGESVAFPCCSKLLAQHLPESSRGFANGVIISAIRCGPAVGTFGAGLLMARYGWRPVFIGIGLASLLWIPAWMRWQPCRPDLPAVTSGAATAADILRQRSFWGASAGHFCCNYLLYFLVTWLPFYLVHERHLTIERMSRIAAAYYLIDAASAMATGWFSDRFIRSGFTATAVRKSAMAIGYSTAAIALVVCSGAGSGSYFWWLLVAGLGSGMGGSGTFAFSQTLAGPHATGRWTGMQNGFANLAGVFGPALTGYTVDWTGNFKAAFAITAAVSLAGALAWTFGVGRLEPIRWARETNVLQVGARSSA